MDIQKFKEQMLIDIVPVRTLKDEINYSHKDNPDLIATESMLAYINQKVNDIKHTCKLLRKGKIVQSHIPSRDKAVVQDKIICMEEMAELIDAISTMESCGEEFALAEDNRMHILEEMADVSICIQLLENMYGFSDEELEKAMRIKLENYRVKTEKGDCQK